MSKRKFYTRFDVPPSPVVDTGTVSSVQQQFRNECDINYIVERYVKRGLPVPFINPQRPTYGVDPGMDYKEAVDFINSSQEAFDNLPATVRAKFGNNVGSLLTFIDDPVNYDEAVSLGLLPAKPQAPVKPLATVPPVEETV